MVSSTECLHRAKSLVKATHTLNRPSPGKETHRFLFALYEAQGGEGGAESKWERGQGRGRTEKDAPLPPPKKIPFISSFIILRCPVKLTGSFRIEPALRSHGGGGGSSLFKTNPPPPANVSFLFLSAGPPPRPFDPPQPPHPPPSFILAGPSISLAAQRTPSAGAQSGAEQTSFLPSFLACPLCSEGGRRGGRGGLYLCASVCGFSDSPSGRRFSRSPGRGRGRASLRCGRGCG